MYWLFFFFFKQKTAYEMRISDWSSDVCSSDLQWQPDVRRIQPVAPAPYGQQGQGPGGPQVPGQVAQRACRVRQAGPVERCGVPGFPVADPVIAEIGRASCRERVCQYW